MCGGDVDEEDADLGVFEDEAVVGLGGDFDCLGGLRGEDRGQAEDEEDAADHAGIVAVGSQCQGQLFFAGDADPFFHLVEVFGEGAAAGGGQAIFGAGDAAFEKFYAGNVLGFFEFAGVDAEIAVSGFEHAFEVVEAEGIVGGEGADDAEADALVDEAIEFGEFGGARGGVLASGFAMFFPRLRLGLGGLAVRWERSSHRDASR